jgi:hypothetical protein
MSFYIRHKDTVLCWQMEAATFSTIAQVATWLSGKHLNWF